MPTSQNQNPSATSSARSRQSVDSRPSNRRLPRRSSSISKRDSLAGSGNGSYLPPFSLPPPIIQVGEGDDDVEIVVDVVNASKRSFAGYPSSRTGSGKSPKRNSISKRLEENHASQKISPRDLRRSTPDHAKRWSPPPFPFASSSTSLVSSKSELSGSSASSLASNPGERSLGVSGTELHYRTQLSLPSYPGHNLSHSANQITSLETADRSRVAASAPDLTTHLEGAAREDTDRWNSDEHRIAEDERETLGDEDFEKSTRNEDDEEKPFLSLLEMSIAISRWNNVAEAHAVYGGAKRPILSSADSEGRSRIGSSSRGYATKSSGVSTGPTSAMTIERRRGRMRKDKSLDAGRGAAPKNRFKTVPTGGIRSSFFGDGVSTARGGSPAKKREGVANGVPELALAGVGAGACQDGSKNGVKSRNGLGRKQTSADWESKLPSEMMKIYHHFKSYDETPRLRRGGAFQDLLFPLKNRKTIAGEGGEGIAALEELGQRPPNGKNVAFDLGSAELKEDDDATSGSRRRSSGAVNSRFPATKSAQASDPATNEKLYRRHIARYYARSASKFDDVKDALFPDLPDLPSGAVSPFLKEDTNEQIWRWLNRDFCKTKLDYFLSLCS